MLLIKGSRSLIFPSLYEGFGLPVLEAMQLGIPVITSNKGSLTEIGGNAVHYVDPLSLVDLTKAIEKLSDNEDLFDEYKLKGLNQAKKFNKTQYQERISKGYEKLF